MSTKDCLVSCLVAPFTRCTVSFWVGAFEQLLPGDFGIENYGNGRDFAGTAA